MSLSYFYDEQFRRYIEQIQRVFSNFKIRVGTDAYGNERFKTIPCVYGDGERMVQHIKRNNSENTMTPVPFIAVYETSVEVAPERRQNPNHVDSRHATERAFDRDTNTYTKNAGSRYTVQRFMPVPYNMRINVDVWYSKNDHKFQIAEQIMTLFNPDINIQTSTNAFDWTALTTLTMESVDWQSRVPSGVEDGIRMITFTFLVPIYINPPAKLKKQQLIHQIITDLHTSTITDGGAIRNAIENIGGSTVDTLEAIFDNNNKVSRVIVTPENHTISVDGNVITLLGRDYNETDSNGNVYNWQDLINQYDAPLVDNISLLRLRPTSDIEEADYDYIGRLRTHEEPNKLYWAADLETIPADTLTAINAMINPERSLPNDELPSPENGQRYIIAEGKIRSTAQGTIWNNISADVGDIIEYDGASWSVVFDASAETGVEYTTNNFSGKKIKFENGEWTILPDGIWEAGFWRLVLGS